MHPDEHQPDQQLPHEGTPPPTVISGPVPDSGVKSNKFPVVTGLAVLAVLIGVSSYLAFGTAPKATISSTTQPLASAAIISATIPPAVVSITNSGFTPATISVKVGQAVDWTNTDTTPHFVTSDNPKPLTNTTPDPKSPQAIDPDSSYNYVFNKIGTYTYHDDLNPNFTGIVVVK